MNIRLLLPVLLFCNGLTTSAATLPAAEDSSSVQGQLTLATNKATTLRVDAARRGFIYFDLSDIPATDPAQIRSARLRIYFPKVIASGAGLEVHRVTGSWDEAQEGLEPAFDAFAVGAFAPAQLIRKHFASADVTAAVRAWIATPAENEGFAIVATSGASVRIGAKEGTGSGYAAQLEVELVADLPPGSVGSLQLAPNLTLGGTTLGTFSGNGSLLTNLSAANLTGKLGANQLAPNLTLGGTTTGTFSGDGAGLANLSAINITGQLTSGQLAPNLTLAGTTTGTFSGNGSGLTGVTVTSFADAPNDVIPVLGMVWIKPGTFIMGSRADEPGRTGTGPGTEGPQTAVALTKGFWMGVHEVTQGEYQAVIGSNPSFFTGGANRPVDTVSWNDAVAYCAALTTTERAAARLPAGWGYRLPTEAEWEYACRAGARTTRFGYGDDLSVTVLANYAWYSGNSGGTTHPVEQKLANPWGLMDMHGNVYEWCHDWIGAYPGGSVTDPQGPASGVDRVLRGGGWDVPAATCRSAARGFSPGTTFNDFGFRVVLSQGQP